MNLLGLSGNSSVSEVSDISDFVIRNVHQGGIIFGAKNIHEMRDLGGGTHAIVKLP